MPTINIDPCTVSAVKADFVKREITITLHTALNDEMIRRRDTLAFLAFDEAPVMVTIATKQRPLPGMEPIIDALEKLRPSPGSGIDSVELSAGGKSVTLNADGTTQTEDVNV